MVYLFRGVPQTKKGGFFVNKLKCASFFAGVGGIDLGFEESDGFETVYANEFDAYPSKTFELNFPNIKVDVRDIREVKSEEIPEFDVMLAGFPCQAFSIAGYRKGFDDEKGRGELFFELTRIIEDKRPRICFFENVKNLVGHDNGNTFRVICEQLDLLGYKYTSQVLNAMHYGNVAQNRERIYIVAFREEEDYDKFHWPLSIPLVAAVIKAVKEDGRTMIFATQRGYGEFKGGWEFPGGKIEAGETPQEALKREIMEELDTEVSVGEWIETVEYDYPGFHLSMDCFWCEIVKGDLVLKEHEAARWLTREELTDVEWLPADVAVAEKIEEEMD